ncbi:MAG: hypothetical protein H7837_11905 [Magnetococcus sp. MYC-9]
MAAIDAKVETIRAELHKDIEATRAELKRDIAAIDAKAETTKADLQKEIALAAETTKADLQKEIALAKVTTIQWTAGMFAAQTALILGALFATGRVGQPTAQQPIYQPPAQEMRQPAPLPPSPPAH